MDKPVLESGEELLALFSQETSQVMMRDDAFTVKTRVRRVGYSHNHFFQQSVFKQSVRFCLCFSFYLDCQCFHLVWSPLPFKCLPANQLLSCFHMASAIHLSFSPSALHCGISIVSPSCTVGFYPMKSYGVQWTEQNRSNISALKIILAFSSMLVDMWRTWYKEAFCAYVRPLTHDCQVQKHDLVEGFIILHCLMSILLKTVFIYDNTCIYYILLKIIYIHDITYVFLVLCCTLYLMFLFCFSIPHFHGKCSNPFHYSDNK